MYTCLCTHTMHTIVFAYILYYIKSTWTFKLSDLAATRLLITTHKADHVQQTPYSKHRIHTPNARVGLVSWLIVWQHSGSLGCTWTTTRADHDCWWPCPPHLLCRGCREHAVVNHTVRRYSKSLLVHKGYIPFFFFWVPDKRVKKSIVACRQMCRGWSWPGDISLASVTKH